MKIGLPNALLYHNYKYLWKGFFAELGQDVIISPESNRQILSSGISRSIDECCLSFKLFMGHVLYLKDRCDAVLIPRIESLYKGETACVKFNALCDIVRNTLSTAILDYNVDVLKKQTEQDGFIKMGKSLGFSKAKSLKAYKNARELQDFADKSDSEKQVAALKKGGLKIMVVAHPYNSHDALIGKPVAGYITRLNAKVIYADKFFLPDCVDRAKDFSPSLCWTYSKHLIGAVSLYKDWVDGIIFLSSFPCGPDSLVNELMLRKLKGVPVCNIIVDELQAESGLETRIESFLDIIGQRSQRCGYGS